MNRTTIPWVRNPDGSPGYTLNPLTGCLGPDGTPESPKRCPFCYAHKLANGRLRKRYLTEPEYPYNPPLLVPNTDESDPFVPRFWGERLSEPQSLRSPSTIFVCSMGDLFSPYYPASWLDRVLQIFEDNARHTFLVLTKNPPRNEQLCFPINLWFGVTINKHEDWFRLHLADRCKAAKRFISFEPLLDDVMKTPMTQGIHLLAFHWIIIGSQTKPYKPPKKEWVRRIVDEADVLGIPVFLKNSLRPLMGEKLRQEFPGGGKGL